MKKLYGTGVALVTPFTDASEVDYKALKRLLVHTAKGVDYYVVMGTTGESVTCSEEEKVNVLEFVKANNPKKLPIVYGLGGNNTASVLEALKRVDFQGVDAILSVSPYYNKPSQEGICLHFEAVANASPRPLVLYNVPGRTGSNITAESTLRLASHQNIIGTKEASGIMEQCMKIMKYKPKDFMLISGDDMMTSSLYGIGGRGVISVLANAFPQIFKKIKDYSLDGAFIKASQEQMKLIEINGPMYEEGNPVGVKVILERMGVCGQHVRLPLVNASYGLQQKINQLCDAIGMR